LAKQSRLPFNPSVISSTKPFAMIHCDIWGPYRHPSLSGAHYFLTVVDDFTRFTWIFLMKHKNEAQSLLKNFFNYVLIQFEVHIKILRSDNDGEFLSLHPFLQEKGALFQHSCVYTLQQNGVVEREHRHILQVARALRFQAQLPLQFWGECPLTTVHIINRLPSPVLSFKTPFELLYSKQPSFSHLRVFGCLTYATNVHAPHKFAPRSIPSVFIGYPIGQKTYKLFDLSNKIFFTSRDMRFHENTFPFANTKPTFSSQNYDSGPIPLITPDHNLSFPFSLLKPPSLPTQINPSDTQSPHPLPLSAHIAAAQSPPIPQSINHSRLLTIIHHPLLYH
jgi:hypothetical protein